ncbi:MAG: MBL fold metallo-hydrolase [Clostridia bacterium]|nr:MBL fold metallo-hydrolase [Clostridia bacterium]
MFVHERENIDRLWIPFDSVRTSVFLIQTTEGYLLFDCASSEYDIRKLLLPELKKQGIPFEDIQWLFCSHFHSDHTGGLPYLLNDLPWIHIAAKDSSNVPPAFKHRVHMVCDTESIMNDLQVLFTPGHSDDSISLLDKRTNTLLSGDALQQRGIGKYGTGIASPALYYQTIQRIRQLQPECLLASHAYDPLGEKAEGTLAVKQYLDENEEYLLTLEAFVKKQVNADTSNATLIAEQFRNTHPNFPSLPVWTVQTIIRKLSTDEQE